MLGRALTRVIDAQEVWARPLGDWVHGIVAAIFGRMITIRSFLNGTWLGHPLHAVLTDVPIGALTAVIVLDVLGQQAGADIALVLGILAMLASAVIGYADYSVTDGKARVRATVHSTLMIVSLVLYLASLALRAGSPADRAVPIALSIVAYLVLSSGAFVGGDVAYVLGNMVDRHAWRPAGAKWAPLEVGPLPEGQLVKARLGAQNLVLVRQGDAILALHDQCAHAGGPLSGGRIVDDRVECPWHQSQYDLSTGHRRRGPTVYDQPTYEVRPTEAGGYEARRTS
jgi:nitrite reductase/ring-hydroxylating ferredoxin subunit/branched-subunit amino acid transport protein